MATKKSASVAHTHSLSNTPVVASPISQDSFTSTWGGAETLWSSLTSTPSKKEQVKAVVHPERPTAAGAKQGKRATQVATRQKGGPNVSPSPKSSSPPSSSAGSEKVCQEKKNPDSEQERDSKTVLPGTQHSVQVSTDSQSNEEVGEKQAVGVSSETNDTDLNIRPSHDVPLSTSTVTGSGAEEDIEPLDSNQPAIMSPSMPQELSSSHSDSHAHHFDGVGGTNHGKSPPEGSVSEDVTQTTEGGTGVVSKIDELVEEKEGEKAGDLVALLEATDGTEAEGTTLGKEISEVEFEAQQPSFDGKWLTEETTLTPVALLQTHNTPNTPPIMEQHTLLESKQTSTSIVPHISPPLSPLPISHSPLPPSPPTTSPEPSPSATSDSIPQTQEVHVTSSGMENQTEVRNNDSNKEEEQKGEEGGSTGEGGAISMRDGVHLEVKSNIVSEDKDDREGQHGSGSGGEMVSTHSSESVQVQQQDSPGLEAVQQVLYIYRIQIHLFGLEFIYM